MLGRLGDVAVAVFAADWWMIWWSPGWAALLGDPSSVPPLLRNFAKNTFPVNGSSPQLWQWPVTSLVLAAREEEVVCDLRRATGRYPHSARLVALVEELKNGNASRNSGRQARSACTARTARSSTTPRPDRSP